MLGSIYCCCRCLRCCLLASPRRRAAAERVFRSVEKEAFEFESVRKSAKKCGVRLACVRVSIFVMCMLNLNLQSSTYIFNL
jgi:hypothetical protein